ncbi:MAG: hypothetical protein IJX57_03990 [Clostridia bacterium]|nr:hypothetical protein [Clostridia bacterium]
MRKKLQEKMFELSYILELIISAIIGVAVAILSVKLCIEMFNTTLWENGDEVLVHILDSAMTLAIGVEFIKMLCKHTPATVIEVLLFAIARQLVVMHTTPLENLITVVSIAILFAVRKYFFRTEDKTGGFFKHKKENSETEGK